jgi:hypothetical protein
MSDLGLDTAPASAASFGAFQPTSPFTTTATQSTQQRLLDRASGALDPTQLLGDGARNALRVGDNTTPRVFKNLPDNLAALNNKYTELAPILNAIPQQARTALIEMDSQRVATGGKPLTKEETLKLAKTWIDQKPATPKAERKPLDVVGNITGDLGAILKSIPQIPAGLIREATSLGQMGEGSNVVSQIANAPGVRLLPGAYIAGNLAEGDINELATHPLFTALDVLPFATAAAKTTKVGRLATDLATAEGRTARPLIAALTQRAEDGALVDRMPRAALKDIRDRTVVGQTVDRVWGGRARALSSIFDGQTQRLENVSRGFEDATTVPERVSQEAAKLVDKYAEMGLSYDDILALKPKMDAGDLTAMSPVELAFKNEYDELTTALGDELVGEQELLKIGGEFYTVEQGKNLQRAYERVGHMDTMSGARTEWMSPTGKLTPDTIVDSLDDALNRTNTQYQRREFSELINVMDAYGMDVGDIRSAYSRMNKGAISPVEFADRMKAELTRQWPNAKPRRSVSEIIRDINAQGGRKDIQAVRLTDALADGNNTRITQALNNLTRRSAKMDFLTPDLVSDIMSARDRYRYAPKGRYSPEGLKRARNTYDEALNRTPPARFGPTIAQRTLDGTDMRVPVAGRPGFYKDIKIEGATSEFLRAEELALGRPITADEIASYTQAITERRWGQFSFGDEATVADLYRNIENETAATWRYLKSQGLEPSFVHVTSKSRARSVMNPKVGPQPVSLSQTKERALDFSPGVGDPAVALSHQAMEIMLRRANEEALDLTARQFGVNESQLRELYSKPARDAAERDPLWGFETHIRDEIETRYTRIEPEKMGFNWKSRRFDKYEQEGVFIPKALAKNMEDMLNPRSVFGGVFDPITKAFRIAVVGLSPRTQLYNVLGGATMLMGETGPGAFRYMGDAIKMVRNPEMIDSLELRRSIGSQRRIMASFDDLSQHSDRVAKARGMASVAGGRTIGRLWNQIQESKAKGLFDKAVEKSFDFNAFFDDTYRTMAYLYGYDKGLTKGMSKEVAERAGMETLRKSMMDWSGLTPVERTLMKSVFPFYSFMNHAIRYVLRYPVDHPLRAAVLAAFAKSQIEDSELLPERMLGYMFIGNQSEVTGRQNALNLASVNPFGDVANMLSFTGFLSATNPAIQTVLESVGLQQGSAELYPSLRFNPESGRLEGVRTNPLIAAVQNTIPQSEVLLSLFGASTEFNQRIQTDPAAAIRTLASAGGLPVLWRNISVPQETFRTELARQDSQQNTLNSALKSGNWQNANRYPGLAGMQEQVQQLPAEVVSQYTPPEQQAIRAQLETLLAQGGGATVPGASGARGTGGI